MTRLSMLLIRVYQRTLSRVFGALSQCRYEPSCSVYGYGALQRFGFRRGWWLALRRIARCAPWGGAGHDPVPDIYVTWRQARHLKHGHPEQETPA